MTADRQALRHRIERLSPAQRAVLAERAEVGGGEARGMSEQLVAWIVPADAQAVDGGAVAAFLRERLPEHMVPAHFVLVDALPRLPNGKVDAGALPDPVRIPHDDGVFVPPRTAREQALAGVWAAVLGIDRIGVHDNFFELGGDSILSIQVVARAKRVGVHLTPDLVFQHQTLGALAHAARGESPADAPRAKLTAAPLAPVQAWFFEQPLASPHHWHQAVWLGPEPGFDRSRFERAVHRLVSHHDALRLTFHHESTGWRQRLAAEAPSVVRDIVLPPCADAELEDALEKTVHEICAATDLARGPLLHAAVVRTDGRSAERLLIALHHLAVDAVSWSILLEDLRALYESDEGASDLAQTTSFLSWCAALSRVAGSDSLAPDRAFWTALPRDLPQLPRERDGVFVEETAVTVTASLDVEDTTRLVQDAHAAYGTSIEDMLLAALARTLAEWMDARRVLVGVERHGREPLVDGADLSRTVGWLTSYFPVVLSAEPRSDAGEILRATKDGLRAIPHRGAGYGVLRYLRDDDVARELASRPVPELIFNHAGRLDGGGAGTGIWRPLGPPFASRADSNGRGHRMEVNTFVAAGSLHVHWTASSEQYDRGTLKRLVMRFMDELRALVAHALTARTSGFTPSDFPDAGLDQEALDRFIAGLGS